MEKGIYLVTEPDCMKKGSGAHRHVEVGVKYLGQHFDIQRLAPECSFKESETSTWLPPRQDNRLKKSLKKTGIWGTIKDIVIFFHNHKDFIKTYKKIKASQPSFIYERVSYCNFKGLIISKLLKIPHFYENNGIKYLERKRIYKSWINGFIAWLEKFSYKKSSFVFFVGLWGDYLNLPSKNWMNIENGIEKEFLDKFKHHKKEVTDKINICFVGSLMKHHNLPFLIKAISSVKNKEKFHFHLIGSKLEDIHKELVKLVPTTYHGFLEREELAEVLKDMHVGLVPDALEYPSHMKIFDYGAAKCIILAPSVKNINHWFNLTEIITFKKKSIEDLSLKISALNKSLVENSKIGQNLHDKIQANFTWDKIFGKKVEIMYSFLDNKDEKK